MRYVKQLNVPRIKSVPNLVRKEGLIALLAIALVCLLSALIDAPLQGPADTEGLPSATVKAPWIFVGIQEILKFLPPLLAGVVLPLAVSVLVGAVPFLPGPSALRRLVFWIVVGASCVLTLWGYVS